MRFDSSFGPTIMAFEALGLSLLVLVLIAVVVVAIGYVVLWALERISYWGAHNKRARQEL